MAAAQRGLFVRFEKALLDGPIGLAVEVEAIAQLSTGVNEPPGSVAQRGGLSRRNIHEQSQRRVYHVDAQAHSLLHLFWGEPILSVGQTHTQHQPDQQHTQ